MTDIVTAAQSEQVEDSVRADEQSMPNLIDLTGDELMSKSPPFFVLAMKLLITSVRWYRT